MYTCEAWGVEQADKYLDQLEVRMRQLIDHPLLGVDYTHVYPDYRRLQVERHAIFYQVFELEVLIIRVLHEDMDVPERLSD
ncbi:toxin ParE1 [Marinospirillum insulare]|uniref:Toxin ParE1 n=2 Tax=Marinospirillum insulare TaxID=217169 RepID=A0ABQ5ZX17_9GAMM|nr:toxin ParE1 [Marinospirillum insulare]